MTFGLWKPRSGRVCAIVNTTNDACALFRKQADVSTQLDTLTAVADELDDVIVSAGVAGLKSLHNSSGARRLHRGANFAWHQPQDIMVQRLWRSLRAPSMRGVGDPGES